MAHNAATQKEWANEQSRQMAEQREREAEEERQYAAQTEALNRMRGMLEDENNNKRANMLKQMQEENKRIVSSFSNSRLKPRGTRRTHREGTSNIKTHRRSPTPPILIS